MNLFFSSFFKLFERLDMYGYPVNLYINSQRTVKSKLGGFVTLTILAIGCFIFASTIKVWSDRQTLQVITSTQTLTVTEMIKNNQSFLFDFDFHNFNVYYVLTANLPDGTTLNYTQLQSYLTQKLVYWDRNRIEHDLDFERCLIMNQRIFLFEDSTDLQSDPNRTSDYSICINQKYGKLPMGLSSDPLNFGVNTPMINYRVEKCQNSSANNNSCASNDDIMNMVKYITVQISVPKSVYDFNNPSNPRQRTYDYQMNYLDWNMNKIYTAQIKPIYLKTDYGILTDDYRLNTIDFNVANLQYETFIRQSDDNLLYEYDFQFGMDQIIYYQRNEKIYVILANFGGIMNILFLLGKIFCHFYNFLVFKHKLINISFENLEKSEQSKNK